MRHYAKIPIFFRIVWQEFQSDFLKKASSFSSKFRGRRKKSFLLGMIFELFIFEIVINLLNFDAWIFSLIKIQNYNSFSRIDFLKTNIRHFAKFLNKNIEISKFRVAQRHFEFNQIFFVIL